jgi:phosphonate transport system permease protein
MKPPAANPPYRLPPRLFDARCKACWFTSPACWCWWLASFASLDLQWRALLLG